MKIVKHILPNNIRVLCMPRDGESVTVTLWAGVGSRHETSEKGGISHFLEHIVFKGSKARPTAQILSESIDEIGAEFNAETSKEWTNFYIKARNEHLEHAFDVLSDMVLHPMLRPVDIEREKGVILEEMAMYEDMPSAKIGDIFEQLVFSGHSLGQDIIGTRESVKSITKSDFVDHINDYYFGGNVLITVAGGVNDKEVMRVANKKFAGMSKGREVTYGERVDKFGSKNQKPQIMLSSQKREQAHMILGFLGNKRDSPNRYAESVLASILGGGMSSRLFSEIREKRGLAYAVRTSVERYIDTGYIETYCGVDPSKAEETIKVILEQVYGLRDGKFKIKPPELLKAKEYMKGHLALSLEDTHNVNQFLGEEELILEKYRTPSEVYKGIDAVTVEDVLRAAGEIFTPSKLNLAIIGPYKTQARFEKLVEA